MSATTTWRAPAARATRVISMPIVPAPITTAVSATLSDALSTECTATASGSTNAPSSSDTLSGSLNVNAAGWTTLGRITPWTGGVAQNLTAGSRL